LPRKRHGPALFFLRADLAFYMPTRHLQVMEQSMPFSIARISLSLLLAGLMIGALVVPADAKGKKAPKKRAKAAAHHVVKAPVGPPVPARNARPFIVIDYASGNVIEAVNPFTPWHPASLTKMMTTYVALQAVKTGRVTKDSLLAVTPFAAKQPPSKMAFAPGTRITLESALYILFVKSANDVAVTIAEGISGSVPAFADEMNAWSQRIGMTGSHWRNPNGWHDDSQITSARDMALLARALYRDFPEYSHLFRAQALQYGEWTMRNYNVLIGRFPGADGIKTGFTCPSGFNLVGSATRGGRRHIAVVLGENSGRARGEKAALLLERSFTVAPAGNDEQRLKIDALSRPADTRASAPNMRYEVCGKHGAPSEADESGPPSQVLSLVQANSAAVGAAIAASSASGETAPLVNPPPPQVTAVVLARSVVDKNDKRPLMVAVAGTALVGAGLALPQAALLPADIRQPTATTAVYVRNPSPADPDAAGRATGEGAQSSTASLAPAVLPPPPSAPVALVPVQPARPGAISSAPKQRAASTVANPAARSSLVAGGRAASTTNDAAPGALNTKKSSPAQKPSTTTPAPAAN